MKLRITELIRFRILFGSRSRSARLLTQSFVDEIFRDTNILRLACVWNAVVLCKFEFLRISYWRQQQLDRAQQHVVTHIKYLCVCKTIPLLAYANRDIRTARIQLGIYWDVFANCVFSFRINSLHLNWIRLSLVLWGVPTLAQCASHTASISSTTTNACARKGDTKKKNESSHNSAYLNVNRTPTFGGHVLRHTPRQIAGGRRRQWDAWSQCGDEYAMRCVLIKNIFDLFIFLSIKCFVSAVALSLCGSSAIRMIISHFNFDIAKLSELLYDCCWYAKCDQVWPWR